MCGFAGFLSIEPTKNPQKIVDILGKMSDAIIHRGPDDSGIWIDEKAGLGLGFRRLSVIDLSIEGHQPMVSASGRFVIVFNGEVYNFQEIKEELEAENRELVFRGHSDTEVILAAIEAWTLERAVNKFIGMFSLALWDRKEQVLRLVRDRFGVKPLYYGWQGNSFLFGSELKALKPHPDFIGEISRDSLALFMRHSWIPAPYTIYKNINKLPQGSILTLDLAISRKPNIYKYWTAFDSARKAQSSPLNISEAEAITQLDELLKSAVKYRMISDVPLGVFLSGGIDSSLVTSLMQVQSTKPIKTFTIGFEQNRYNEAKFAKDISTYLGTQHTELYISDKEALDTVGKMPLIYDEPFADSSQIPTYLVSKLARKQVTVSLSGDGGDEMFGGYNRHYMGQSIWNKIGNIPYPIRKLAVSFLDWLPQDTLEHAYFNTRKKSSTNSGPWFTGDKINKMTDILRSKNQNEVYSNLLSICKNPNQLVIDGYEPETIVNSKNNYINMDDFASNMMIMDSSFYLPDDILVKVDRASMAVSLETREPLLDHRIYEYAWRLPMDYKIHDGNGKHILRQLLYNYLPKDLVNRAKMGFAVPLADWMRGPLRELCEEMFSEKRIKSEGYLNYGIIKQKWDEHLSNRHQNHQILWCVLMFELWLSNSD